MVFLVVAIASTVGLGPKILIALLYVLRSIDHSSVDTASLLPTSAKLIWLDSRGNHIGSISIPIDLSANLMSITSLWMSACLDPLVKNMQTFLESVAQ